jgi:type 1 glutamine amidotransferase
MRRAVVVRGGWDGHEPDACTDSLLPFLRKEDFEVTVSDDPAVYADPAVMATTDLVVQCRWSGQMSPDQLDGLLRAVRAGTGFAGWHRGVVTGFDAAPYLHLTGGQLVYCSAGAEEYELAVIPGRQHHPIMAGFDRMTVCTEKYWVLTDDLCDVLATVTFLPDRPGGVVTPWRRDVPVPAIWTRQWGAGRVFASTVVHTLADLENPTLRGLTERGLLWAARE